VILTLVDATINRVQGRARVVAVSGGVNPGCTSE
jgi:hypothetical protein